MDRRGARERSNRRVAGTRTRGNHSALGDGAADQPPNLILGTIHPPIGVVLFVMARIADVTFEQISRAILPWLVPLLIVLAAITVWPPLTLWLPGLVMNK